MTAADWLARARAVTDAATPGPWEALDGWYLGTTVVAPRQRDLIVSEDGAVPCLADPNDAAFIAASRTMLPAAVAAIEAVLALTFASDDGSEWPHRDGCTGEPECPACWAEGIRNALDGAS